MMTYFDLLFDVERKGGWLLGGVMKLDGSEILSSEFMSCTPYSGHTEALKASIILEGSPADYTLTAMGTPIVSPAMAKVLAQHETSGLEFIPIKAGGEEYLILNILHCIECLDLEQSHVTRYSEPYDDPETLGKIEGLTNTKIKPEWVGGHHIFRLAEYPIVIVISKELRKQLEANKFTGMKFKRV